MGGTLYELIDVPATATEDTIKQALTQKQRFWSKRASNAPSLAARQEAERKMGELSEARRVLLDAQARAVYDASLGGGGVGAPPGPGRFVPQPAPSPGAPPAPVWPPGPQPRSSPGPVPPPAPPGPQPAPVAPIWPPSTQPPPPRTQQSTSVPAHWSLVIISCFLFWPLGLAVGFFAFQVGRALLIGDEVAALRSSRRVKRCFQDSCNMYSLDRDILGRHPNSIHN